MSKQTAENVILSQTLVKNHAQIQLLPFDSYYAIFHICEFSLVPKCAYLEDPLYRILKKVLFIYTRFSYKVVTYK